jgi:glyoxylate reductase
MGGTLAKHSRRGDEIHIILCTLGIGGNSGDPKGREDEAQAAAKILNAKLHILDFPVVKLNKPSIEFESILKRTVDDINPDRLYTHSPFDYHQVHESVSECTRNAARDIQQVLYYEVISSTSPEFGANAYVDITDYIDKKIECLAHHNTQSTKLYMQAHIIRSLAHTRYLMSKIGTRQEGMAEAFTIGRMTVIPNSKINQHTFRISSSVAYASNFVMKASSNKQVYVTRKIPEPGLSMLSRECNVTLNQMSTPPDKIEIIKNVVGKDAILCTVSDKIDAQIMDAAGPKLKIISSYSSGYDHIDVREATARGVYVTFTAHVPAEATADLTFALILACARNIVSADECIRKNNWKVGWAPDFMLGYDVYGSTLGIIGLGRIGSAVARRARGFGMKILYSDHYRNFKLESELQAKYTPLDELLAQADFVSIHTSMSSESYHLIDRSKLEKMKRTAFLINTARGQVINEVELVAALKDKLIAGVGLDVFEAEPLPKSSPLMEMKENIVILPHMGCATYRTRSKMAEVAARNLLDVLDGKELDAMFLVNPEVRDKRIEIRH